MAGSDLHYILGWEACDFHCCTMRLYWKHHFIYQKLTGPHITYICIFIVMLKHYLSDLCENNYRSGPSWLMCKAVVRYSYDYLTFMCKAGTRW